MSGVQAEAAALDVPEDGFVELELDEDAESDLLPEEELESDLEPDSDLVLVSGLVLVSDFEPLRASDRLSVR